MTKSAVVISNLALGTLTVLTGRVVVTGNFFIGKVRADRVTELRGLLLHGQPVWRDRRQ